jgi:dihydroxyacetone kinase-like protein
MGVSLKQWQKMFDKTADLLLEHAEELSKIDAVIGDGDHGLTISKIAHLMKDKSQKIYESASVYFDDLGWDAINVQGGSAGPLFGTWLSGMKNAKEGAGVAEVLECALEELRTISQAKIGEKTMMDAIIPATEAAKGASNDANALEAAEKAAKEGAEHTAGCVAKYGRAKNYGEQTIGVKDAGACSMALIFQGLRAGYQAEDEKQ